MLLTRIELGGCYQFWALDGSDPPESLFSGQDDQDSEGESPQWRDAYTVEFGKEGEP